MWGFMRHFILALAVMACTAASPSFAYQSEALPELKTETEVPLSVPDAPVLQDGAESPFGFASGDNNPFGGSLHLDPVPMNDEPAAGAFTYRLTPEGSDVTVKFFAMPPVEEVTSGVIGLQLSVPLNKPRKP